MTQLALIAVSGMGVLTVILLVLAWLIRRQHSSIQPPEGKFETRSVHDKVMSLHGSDLDPRLQDALAELALKLDRQLATDRRR
jgi:hypothetical protein